MNSHVNLEAVAGDVDGLSLTSMKTLLAALGDPQTDYPAVHITGTNGKGSVAAMISALATAKGMTVGAYTSPNVERINQRLTCYGQPIEDSELTELLSHLKLVVDHLPPEHLPLTWFELVTAAALWWFSDVAVDVAVVEVGKLGRYDATNVIGSQVAVITNIGYDHTDGRPGWQAAIMGEKAGILHPGVTAVVGSLSSELVAIAAQESPKELLVLGQHFEMEKNDPAVGGRLITVSTPKTRYEDIYISLFGAHQGDNAALAITAFECLTDQELDESLLAALGEISVPARFEVVGRQPLTVIDGAHNPEGMAAVASTLRDQFDVSGSVIWVLGMMSDKDAATMLEAIGDAGVGRDLIVGCTPNWPRAQQAEDLAAAARRLGLAAEAVTGVADAVERALDFADAEDAVVITGSMYTAGAARLHLVNRDH